MSPNSWDASPAGGRRLRRQFLPGVYNYCDSWCERCRFQQQCRLFHDRARYLEALKRGQDALDRFLFDDDPDDEAEEAELTAAELAERAQFLALDEETPSEDELRRIDQALEDRQRRKDVHPLSVDSAGYLDAVRGVVGPLREMIGGGSNPLNMAALEAIERHAHLMMSKLRRAAGALVGSAFEDDDDHDPRDRQSDANGCAKLARLLIAESRESWALLAQSPPAAAEGLPLAMIERLNQLDKQVHTCFPKAMSFLRPGFDDASR